MLENNSSILVIAEQKNNEIHKVSFELIGKAVKLAEQVLSLIHI